jgi:hypothetical protein
VKIGQDVRVYAAGSRITAINVVTVAVGLLAGAGAVLLLFGGDDGARVKRVSRAAPADTRIVVGPDSRVQTGSRRVLLRQGDDAVGRWKVRAYRDRDMLCLEVVRYSSSAWWTPLGICGGGDAEYPPGSESGPVFGQFVVPGDGGGVVFGAVRSDVARVRIESKDGTDADETVAKSAVGARFFVANLDVARFGEVTRTAYDANGRVLEHNVDPQTSGSYPVPP